MASIMRLVIDVNFQKGFRVAISLYNHNWRPLKYSTASLAACLFSWPLKKHDVKDVPALELRYLGQVLYLYSLLYNFRFSSLPKSTGRGMTMEGISVAVKLDPGWPRG